MTLHEHTTERHLAVTAWLEHLEQLGDNNPNCVCLDGRTPGCPQHPQEGHEDTAGACVSTPDFLPTASTRPHDDVTEVAG